jgi:hypothetical protein
LAWSQDFKKYFSKTNHKNILEIGHPLWSMYWKLPIGILSRINSNRNRKLYFENLAWVNLENRKKLSITFSPEQELSLTQMKNRIKELTKELNRRSFTVKIRPSSTKSRDLELKQYLKNVKLVRGFPSIHYISKSDYCFGDFSSAIIDSLLLGLPSYGFCIDKIPRKLRFSWHSNFVKTSHFAGRRVDDLWILDRYKTLNFLIGNGYINENYFASLAKILQEHHTIEVSTSKISKIEFSLIRICLIFWHFISTSLRIRKMLYYYFRPKLDIETHTQDFISLIRFYHFHKYAKKLLLVAD